MDIQFIDLQAQRQVLLDKIDKGVQTVMEHGRFVMGPEIQEFESALAEFGNAKHVCSCANGTDAILLPLMAWGIGPGDAVFCPSFTYCATAEVIAHLGATPVFIDIDRQTYNMCADSMQQAINMVRAQGDLTPRAVISVDLFGQSAEYEAIAPIVRNEGLKLIADSAQGFGTTLNGKHPLAWADIATTSFFPAKPLGCYGDGGAVLTNDADLAHIINSLRIHGQGVDRYDNVRVGINSRLDTLQAAILLAKLSVFAEEIEKRNHIAKRYSDALANAALRVPHIKDGIVSTWAQYTIEVPDPVGFAQHLQTRNIPTARYYPKPIHMQTAYNHYPLSGNGLPKTEDCIDKVISLPMHPYLESEMQDYIITACLEALEH